MLEENQLNTDFLLLSDFPFISFAERPARPTATERLSLRTCTKTSPRRPESSAEPNLWSSVCAAHRSRTNTKETGVFLFHSSHHNGCFLLPASDCPPSFLPAHVALHCGTSGHRLLMEKKKFIHPFVCFPAGCWDKLVACLFSALSAIPIAAGGVKIELSESSAGVVLLWGRLSHSNSWFFFKAIVCVMRLNNWV